MVNIDYPLGVAAYNILREVAVSSASLRGVYVLGKAATLNADVGDVMLSSVIHDEHSSSTYWLDNAFGVEDLMGDLRFGTGLDNQRAVSVKSTFLQNRAYLDFYYREAFTVVEMEAGPYCNAIYEIADADRHPVGEAVNFSKLPLDFGVIHYASDTPYTQARTLEPAGSRTTAWTRPTRPRSRYLGGCCGWRARWTEGWRGPRGDSAGNRASFGRYSAPGVAERPVTRRRQRGVAGAVVLEGGRIVVRRPAIELHHTRFSRQRQSSLRLLPPTIIGTFVSGSGMLSIWHSSRKACSSSLLTIAPGRCVSTAAMRMERRWRPFARSIARSSAARSSTPWNSASRMIRVRRSRPNVSVRSTSVRATVVTGMRFLTVTSSSDSCRTR